MDILKYNWKSKISVKRQYRNMGLTERYVVRLDDKVIGTIENTTNMFIKIIHNAISNTWLPFTYTLFTKEQKVIARVRKPKEPWSSQIYVENETGEIIGSMRATQSYIKNIYDFVNGKGRHLAGIVADVTIKNIHIKPLKQVQMGIVTVQRNNLIQAAFAPKFQYDVQLARFDGTDAEKFALTVMSIMAPIIIKELHN